MSSELHTIQFTEKELAPLRRCIDAHRVATLDGVVSPHVVTHVYEVACGTVVYKRHALSENIELITSKAMHKFKRDNTLAPRYYATIKKDNSVIGDQEAIDIIADTVGVSRPSEPWIATNSLEQFLQQSH